jgi:hypothetical protein
MCRGNMMAGMPRWTRHRLSSRQGATEFQCKAKYASTTLATASGNRLRRGRPAIVPKRGFDGQGSHRRQLQRRRRLIDSSLL